MNRDAIEYIKDLESELENISGEYTKRLEEIPPNQFRYDVSESILGEINTILYEINTIISDIESGEYPPFMDGGEDDYDLDD